MRQGPRAAVAADAIAAALGFDVNVFLDFGVPVLGFPREAEKRDAAHLLLGAAIAQLLSRIDDLFERAAVAQLVTIQELENRILLVAVETGLFGIGAEGLDVPGNVDGAARHVLADALAGVAEDDDASAVHHIAGHEIGIAGAEQGAFLHHLAGARADVAMDDKLGAANADACDGAGVASHHHRAAVHVVTEAPADVVVDFEVRAIGESRAEVTRRAANVHVDCVGEPYADVMARVGIEDGDVLTRGSALADALVGLAYRDPG